jgi:hypothetical protein
MPADRARVPISIRGTPIKARKLFAKHHSDVLAQSRKQVSPVKSLRELLLLGRLLVRSCGGSELLHTLDDFSEDEKPITPRAFKTLLEQLHADHLICTVCAWLLDSHQKDDHSMYKITAQGLARFQFLMSCEHENLSSRPAFRAKLLHIDYVGEDIRRRIARSYMQRIKCSRIQAIAKNGFFQHDAKMGDPDRTMILRMVRRERAVADAEFEWMTTDMATYL